MHPFLPAPPNILLTLQLFGGVVVCFLGLSAGCWLRFHPPFRHLGIMSANLCLPVRPALVGWTHGNGQPGSISLFERIRCDLSASKTGRPGLLSKVRS